MTIALPLDPKPLLSSYMEDALLRAPEVVDGRKVRGSVKTRTKFALRRRGLATLTEKGWRLTESGLVMRRVLLVRNLLASATR